MDAQEIRINGNLSIPISELLFRFVRSSGPGGQHVNRSATQVELAFDVGKTTCLSADQKVRIREKLANLINKEGILRLASQSFRSQRRNREAVLWRFEELLGDSLRVPKRRHATRPTAGSKEKRLNEKRQKAILKRDRQSPPED